VGGASIGSAAAWHFFRRGGRGRAEAIAGPATASTYSMVKVRFGWKEFDVNSERIDAGGGGIADVACVAFAARMNSGEISRLKTLILVRFVLLPTAFREFSRNFVYFSSPSVRANMSFAGLQPCWRRGSEGNCFSSAREYQVESKEEQQLEITVARKLNFRSLFRFLSFRSYFYRCVRANMSFAEQQPSWRRGSEGDCFSSARE
jgi:hypothetical protein